MMAIVWLVVGGCGCGLRGGPSVPRVRDGGHAHIRGLGTPRPLFVACPLSIVERGRPGRRLLRRRIAELLCASRDARAASLAVTGVVEGVSVSC